MKLHASFTARSVIAFVASALVAPALTYGNVGIFGVNNTAVRVVTSDQPTVLVSVTTNLSTAHGHTCAVTATAGTNHRVAVQQEFIFYLARGGTASLSSERTISVLPVGVDDSAAHQPVETNATFQNVRGQTMFTFRARKATNEGGNLKVTPSTISVDCQPCLLPTSCDQVASD